MLIQYLLEHPDAAAGGGDADPDGSLATLDQLYRKARSTFDADPDFASRARHRVGKLQSGDAETLEIWRDLRARSQRAFSQVYDRLGVLLQPEDSVGESFYNPVLAEVTEELLRSGVAVMDADAVCVYFDDILGSDGDPVPMIVQKGDGGFGYAAPTLPLIGPPFRLRGG